MKVVFKYLFSLEIAFLNLVLWDRSRLMIIRLVMRLRLNVRLSCCRRVVDSLFGLKFAVGIARGVCCSCGDDPVVRQSAFGGEMIWFCED